jgi:hypothetical protein
MARRMSPGAAALPLALLGFCGAPHAEPDRPDLQGMWSDVSGTVEDMFCDWGWCTDVGRDHLTALLDDPANDARLTIELYAVAARHQIDHYVVPRLTPAARATLDMDAADDPGFLECEPWGFARQVFAPHQLQIAQLHDRVEFRYGTWDARRTIWLDEHPRPDNPPSSRLGFSVGR